jgi:fructose-1-phosphate kinase PfkB-like protein
MRVLRTVTLNSGFDDTFTVSGLDWGGVGRVRGFRSVPSGKGVPRALPRPWRCRCAPTAW